MSSLETRFDDKDYSLERPGCDLFDQWLSEDPESLISSDNSNDSNLFDDLDLGLPAQNGLFNAASPFAAPATPFQPIPFWKQSSRRQDRSPSVMKTQKLAYRLKPDGAAISAGDLLAIEGKILTTPPMTPGSCLGQWTARNLEPTGPLPFSGNLCHRTRALPRVVVPSVTKQPDTAFRSMPPEALRKMRRTRFEEPHLQMQKQSLPLSPPPSSRFAENQHFKNFDASNQRFLPVGPNSIKSESNGPALSEDVLGPLMLNSAYQDPWLAAIDPRLFPNSPPLVADWSPGSTNGLDQSFTFGPPLLPQLDTSFGSIGLGISFGDLTSSPLHDPFVDPVTLSSSRSNDNCAGISPRTSRSRFNRSAAPSPSPHESPRQSRQRSKGSRKQRPASGSKTPRTPSGSGTLDFVNFTASDNQKILTAVAPSGSSKTKARREREASERRRKLSQAAAKAVRDAGGDVEALRKEGLLV